MQKIQSQTITQALHMTCMFCHQLPKNHQEVMELNFFGCHLTCDHVMADVNDQRKADYEIQN